MSLKPEKFSQQSRETSIPTLAPTSVLGDGDQLAPPKLEQDIQVQSRGYFYLELLIWSPYVSHFKETPSVSLFLVEMQVKMHNPVTPSC